MSACPSCGRDPGSNDICPHCGADLKHRVRIRNFGLASIVIAVLGLIVLYVFATHAPIAQVKIRDVESSFNYAYVQIDGQVSRGPSYNADSQSLTFYVRDDTGELMISAFRSAAQDLIASDKIPAPGDTVSVQGTLRVREAVPSLNIDSAQAVSIQRAGANAPMRELGTITSADALHGVTIRGMVRAVKIPYDGLKLVTVRDSSGAIDIAISSDVEQLLGAAPVVTVGQSIQVIGSVTLFDTTPQLTLNRGSDMSVLDQAIEIAQPVSIGALHESDAGRFVQLGGVVDNVSPFSAGVRVSLADGDQHIDVLFWQDVWDGLSIAPQVQPGVQMMVQGEVNAYRGSLEIVPEIDQDIALTINSAETKATPAPAIEATIESTLEPTSTPQPSATETLAVAATVMPASTSTPTSIPQPSAPAASISQLTANNVGQTYQVHGKVVEVASFSAGFDFLLNDGTGRIKLTLFNDTYKFVAGRSGLNLGADVSVAAEVQQFNGVLELQPQSGKDVSILTPGSSNSVALRQVNSLSKPGEIVAVEGAITDIKDFSSGKNIFVDDGTGNVKVTIFSNVLAYVPATKLVVGANVRVVGKTSFFGRIELDPQLGYDVIFK